MRTSTYYLPCPFRVTAIQHDADGTMVTLPLLGSRLLHATRLAATPGRGTAVRRAGLEGNACVNLYLVGAGPRNLADPLSLMHVK